MDDTQTVQWCQLYSCVDLSLPRGCVCLCVCGVCVCVWFPWFDKQRSMRRVSLESALGGAWRRGRRGRRAELEMMSREVREVKGDFMLGRPHEKKLEKPFSCKLKKNKNPSRVMKLQRVIIFKGLSKRCLAVWAGTGGGGGTSSPPDLRPPLSGRTELSRTFWTKLNRCENSPESLKTEIDGELYRKLKSWNSAPEQDIHLQPQEKTCNMQTQSEDRDFLQTSPPPGSASGYLFCPLSASYVSQTSPQ